MNNWGWRRETTAASDAAVVGWVHQALAEPAWAVDPGRVHFVGFSEGGLMAWRMLCKHADLFASVAVLEAANGKNCEFTPGMPEVPVLYQNGVYDVPSPFPYARRTVARLTAAWGAGAGAVVASDGHYNRTRYISARGTPIDFIAHDYVADYVLLGHCFPGSNDTAFINPSVELPLVGPFGCPGRLTPHRAGYVVGDEVMKWFLAHRRVQ